MRSGVPKALEFPRLWSSNYPVLARGAGHTRRGIRLDNVNARWYAGVTLLFLSPPATDAGADPSAPASVCQCHHPRWPELAVRYQCPNALESGVNVALELNARH